MTEESEIASRNTIIIAVTGKRGVGKTSIAAVNVDLFTQTYPDKKFIAIDADPAVGLATALGIKQISLRVMGKVIHLMLVIAFIKMVIQVICKAADELVMYKKFGAVASRILAAFDLAGPNVFFSRTI